MMLSIYIKIFLFIKFYYGRGIIRLDKDIDLKLAVRTIKDFPKQGILYYDIMPVLGSSKYLTKAIDCMFSLIKNIDFDLIVCPESRGFIFGMPLAYKLQKGFVAARKPGKLPYLTIKKSYALEYGMNTIEVHMDAIKSGQRVVIIDDLLATGGTCKALSELVGEIGGKVVNMTFLIELKELNGREILSKFCDIASVLQY
jgi:adenine phosphoribosyltransferase